MKLRKKKNEFRQDKPYSGFFRRLYLTRKQRQRLLYWGLYAVVLVALSVLQDVLLCRLRVYGATTDLVPCAIMLICVLEGAESGSVFALVASSLYVFSGSAPGIYSLAFITVFSVAVTVFRQSYLQRGFVAGLLCVAVALIAYELSVFAIGLFLGRTTGGRILGFLITAGMSLVSVPLLYPVLNSIRKAGEQAWTE